MKSDAVKTGMQQAPHRSLFNALGMTKEELEALSYTDLALLIVKNDKKIIELNSISYSPPESQCVIIYYLHICSLFLQ